MSLHAQNRWEGVTHKEVSHIGAYGVDLFFVISGFIVCNVARRAPSAADFLRSRFIRVAPVYYVQSAPWFVITLGLGKLTAAALATTLLFWPLWGRGPTEPIFRVGWTLCFEALFYCSLGAVVQWRARAAVLLGAAYAIALALNFANAGAVFQFIGSPLMLEFLAGAAIASMAIRNRPRAGVAAVVAAFGLLAFRASQGIGPVQLVYPPLIALQRVEAAGPSAFLLVWGCLQLEPWFRGRFVGALSYLGDASYSIYLTHPIALFAVDGVWRVVGLPLFGLPFVDFAVGIGAGVLGYRTVEAPLLALLRRKLQPPVQLASAA